MATKLVTKAHTLTGDPTRLSAVLEMSGKTWISSVTMRAAVDNVGLVYWADSDGEAGGYLQAEEGVTIDLDGGTLAGTFYIQGAASDKVYLSVGVSSYYFDLGDGL